MKPTHGFQKEIYDVLEEHGPLAYTSIHKHLKARGSEIKPKQVRKALDNLRSRGFAVRTETDRRKYTVVVANQVEIETETPDPIQSPSLVEKTPESVEVTPTEGLSQLDSSTITLIAAIAAGTAALTTIILRFV
jgi:DNA-binding Lrp family transcriptional regulator